MNVKQTVIKMINKEGIKKSEKLKSHIIGIINAEAIYGKEEGLRVEFWREV